MRFIAGYIKLFLIIVVLVTSVNFSEGQKDDKKKSSKRKDPHVVEGDRFFGLLEFIKASEAYKRAYEHDNTNHYALYRLAESYYRSFDYINAEKYYQLATQTALHDYPLSRYWYAIMLKDNGKYLEAVEEFSQFRKEYKATDLQGELYKEKAIQESNGCNMALQELKKPQRDYQFAPLAVPGNSEEDDYSVVIMQNDSSISVTSGRKGAKGKLEAGTGGSLTDIYRYKKSGAHDWAEVHDHDGFSVVNGPMGERAGSFNGDHTRFYFTRCDEKVKQGSTITYVCAIYVSHIKDGKWQKPIKLNENVNMKGQWNGEPSVSPDGHVLFFVSTRPGGIGMHDIWFCTSPGDDNWSTAINMGEQVNTLFSDRSPRYYANEKTLFFSSNGREGFGGYDVYFVHEDNLDSIKNIGLPFNSNRDDQDFVLGEKTGYISSNREGGIGRFDVYSFGIDSKESLIAYINNDTATVPSISVEGQLTHADTKEPASDVGITLTDEQSKKLKTSTTNDEGKFRFENLPTDKNYKVVLEEENPNILKQTKYVVEKVEVKGSKQGVSKVLFENIYFDFNKFELKDESKKVLDRLYAFCKKHPEIQIELSANTDSYGSDDYNKTLSYNRGNEALKYLVTKGVDKSALVVNAEGEGKPVANNNSEIGRQLNRRVEFYILGGPGYVADVSTATINPKEKTLYYVAKQFGMSVEELEKYMQNEKNSSTADYSPSKSSGAIDYYIVQPKNTLFSIARLYGMSVDELKSVNGFTAATPGLVIGQKVKVNIKSSASPGFYLVKNGDTLYSIAKSHGLTVEELVQLNNLEGYILRRNMILKVTK